MLMAATDGAIMAGPIGAIPPIVNGDASWPSECGVRPLEEAAELALRENQNWLQKKYHTLNGTPGTRRTGQRVSKDFS
jgi:hypothetical protein